jgi:hypothetical protein
VELMKWVDEDGRNILHHAAFIPDHGGVAETIEQLTEFLSVDGINEMLQHKNRVGLIPLPELKNIPTLNNSPS